MKRIYALGFAALIAFGATAAPKASKADKSVVFQKEINLDKKVMATSVRSMAAPAKAVTSVKDLYGLKKWTGNSEMLIQNGGKTESTFMMKAGPNNNSVIAVGFPVSWASTTINVNIANKTLTLTNGMTVDGQDNNENDLKIFLYEIVEEDGKPKLKALEKASATIGDDGKMVFNPNVAIECASQEQHDAQRCYVFQNENVIEGTTLTKIDLAEYDLLGEAKFTDGWLNGLIVANGEEPIVDVPVNCYRHKTEQHLIVLENPYAGTKWKEVNAAPTEADSHGFIQLNVKDHDFVGVMPLIVSGLWVNDKDENNQPIAMSMLVSNMEGDYISKGANIEQIKVNWMLNEVEASTVDEEGVVLIHNCYFGTTEDPTASYWYGEDAVYEGKVSLPEGWSGISNVAADANAPVRYYNLQGVQIAAPVKGQLVIKTQGNKSMKFIGR